MRGRDSETASTCTFIALEKPYQRGAGLHSAEPPVEIRAICTSETSSFRVGWMPMEEEEVKLREE